MRLLLVVIVSLQTALYSQQRPAVDGDFSEWSNVPPLAVDPAGDGPGGGVDFTRLHVSCDERNIYVMIDVGAEMLLQSDNALTLYLDTDCSESTGRREGDLGAELAWTFGTRKGIVYAPDGNIAVGHAVIGFCPAPSFTSTRFEFSFRRDAIVRGMRLFPLDSFRLAIADRSTGGDRIPDGTGHVVWKTPCGPWPSIAEISPGKEDPEAVRILSWNVLQDGIFEPAQRSSITRILQALRPDILLFQEVFDHAAGDVETFVRSILPSPDGLPWTAWKIDAGNILVTTAALKGSAEILPGFRESAFLLRMRTGADLLLIACHLRCCTADLERQQEADAITAFLRDARSGTGTLTIGEYTPVIIAGDLNLVGRHRQLLTLLTGDIEDNTRFGPDAAPGWNGRPLHELSMRHIGSGFNYTWRDSTSSFAPGKLDYVLITPERLSIAKAFVFDAGELSATERARFGLVDGDSHLASDHLPCVLDFRIVPAPTGIRNLPAPGIRQIVYPNPVPMTLNVEVPDAETGFLIVRISDVLGRCVAEEDRVVQTGLSRISVHVGMLPDGIYLVTVFMDGLPWLRRNIVKCGAR